MNKKAEQIQKAFHEAVNDGLKLLEAGRISWEQYAFMMLGFEAQLKQEGVKL